ncbi:uncharacterized protein CXorf65 homolog isoform X1 [Actinia tenebrosa]|uniref:Uncharacterized protein CXorf65 homolog isoform X1 n=1 Tax=Actinia tenebrosa TaxID=6105 RepID=A0A6P8H571_ACTTE|nr:uncharacterized protein CXorf65 homolog isoform X1 [Actinia tenebrosa]
MFVIVRYADDRRELFNPDCRSCLLLNNIKERCDCDEDDIVDLSDETGCLKNLIKHPLEYATKFLTSREILVLVKGEKTDDNQMTFVPLLESLEDNKEFLERLNPPPPKQKEEKHSSPRNSARGMHPGLGSKRTSLVPRPSKNLGIPQQSRNLLSPNMGRRSSRARSQSVQLSHTPLNLLKKPR